MVFSHLLYIQKPERNTCGRSISTTKSSRKFPMGLFPQTDCNVFRHRVYLSLWKSEQNSLLVLVFNSILYRAERQLPTGNGAFLLNLQQKLRFLVIRHTL